MQEETCGVVEFLYKCNCENVEHWCSQTRKLTENLAQGNLCWIVATYKAGTETTAPIERLGQKMQANRKRREVFNFPLSHFLMKGLRKEQHLNSLSFVV
jgi:hypothetical protein